MFDFSLVNAAMPLTLVMYAAVFAVLVNLFHSPHDVIEDVRVAYGPSRKKTVFVVSRHNLLRGVDEGAWERLTTGLGPHKLSALAISPAFERDQTLFVGSFGGGVFRSRNAGLSWGSCSVALAHPHILRLAIAPDFERSGVLLALGLDGVVYISRNRGDTWCAAFRPHVRSTNAASLKEACAVLRNPIRDAGEEWKLCHQPAGATCIGFGRDGMLAGSCDGTLYASWNSGASWQPFARLPDDLRITCVEIPAGASLHDTLFAGTESAGVFRISESGSRVENTESSGLPAHVTALASRPGADLRLSLYACTWDAALYVSQDHGSSWQRCAQGLTTHRQADERRFGAPHFNAVALGAGSSEEVYVGGFDGLFRAAAPGVQWEALETLVPGMVIDLALSPAQGGEFAVAMTTYGAGVAVRSTVGASWKFMNGGLSTTRLGPVAFSPDYSSDHTLIAGSEGRVLRSGDEGRSWRAAALIPESRRGRSVRLFARLRAGERWAAKHLNARAMKLLKAAFQSAVLCTGGRVSHFVFPSVVAFSPDYSRDHTVFVGTRAHGIFRSQDAGHSFHPVGGLSGRFVFALVCSPAFAADGVMFACVTDGLYASTDAGATWMRKHGGRRFRYATLALSPRFETDATLFVGGRDGLHRSRDAGEVFEPLALTSAEESLAIGGIALSPSFATDRTLLVYGRGAGLFRSTDGGDRFTALPWAAPSHDPGFGSLNCFPDSATLVRFSPNFSQDRTVVAACLDQVYQSTDAGSSWDALGRTTRYENSRAEIVYHGRWALDFHTGHSSQQAHRAQRPLDAATLRFVGTRVSWLGTKGPDHGVAQILIDGQASGAIDLYAPEPQHSRVLYTTDVPRGIHTITVQVQTARNQHSKGRAVLVDAFDVELQSESAVMAAASVERIERAVC
ncbi:MAG: hypothetical protein ABI885_16850 [Gammaproteobacteria bacterium]